MKRFSLRFILLLVFCSVLVALPRINTVQAGGTIYIRADGSVDPDTANISTVNNVTYTFTGNINDEIVVERDNITVDGAGYTLQRTYTLSKGINLTEISNVTIKNMKIKEFFYGIWLEESSGNTIYGNNITNNMCGIYLEHTSSGTISGNSITNSYMGIELWHSSNTSVSENDITTNNDVGVFISFSSNIRVSGNNITNNGDGIYIIDASSNIISGNTIAANQDCGIRLDLSKNNTFYHNNLLNTHQVINEPFTFASFWDNSYHSGGNYWSDYNGTDFFSGPYQNETGSDGIGDTSYSIPIFNMYGNISGFHNDTYPLMGMFSDFNATSEHHVQTICNSTIPNFQFNGSTISFYVTGEDETTGFCRICIPTALINNTYKVFVNGTEVQYTLLPVSNSTHSYLYFTYNHSTQEVIVIPEFPTCLSMLVLVILTVAPDIYKRRSLKTPTH